MIYFKILHTLFRPQNTQTERNKSEQTEVTRLQKCVAAPRRICIPIAIAIFLAFLPLEAKYG